MAETAIQHADFRSLTAVVIERLKENRRIRRNLPGGGRVKIDRQLPFLCVYRMPADGEDDVARHLVTTEAAYLVAPGEERYHKDVTALCDEINLAAQEHFDAFLLIEVWTASEGEPDPARDAYAPAFRIFTGEAEALPTTVNALERALSEIEIAGRKAEVQRSTGGSVAPPGRAPILSASSSPGCFLLGVEVRPIFRDATTGTVFPLMLQRLRSRLAVALRQAVFAFTDSGADPQAHFESLGPTALTRAARQADQELCEISFAFDFLQQVTPLNSAEAWGEFQRSDFSKPPDLRYRPLPYHPSLLKRRLFEVPVERMEDTSLTYLCAEKQDELDIQLTALRELGTSRFLYNSLQLYGEAEAPLVELAEGILRRLPIKPSDHADSCATADEVVASAEREIRHYQKRMPDFDPSVVRDDVAAGLMVARGQLHVSHNVSVRRSRIEALMHHEIGTHLLTYYNGAAQPFRLLQFGLAGYEALQEGLAVLAEYLAGGLSRSRLRTLAARVLAVRWMIDGADFVETFRRLRERGFANRSAFMTTLRVFRGGGLTKDAIYLRGLLQLLDYLAAGHDLEPLYAGKFGLQHVPFVRELRRRGVLRPPVILPRLWDDPHFHDRLEACRGMTLLDLAEHAQ